MLAAPTPQHRRRDWAVAATWALLIFACVPLARKVQHFVAEHWGRQAFTYVVVAAVLVTTAVAMVRISRRGLSFSLSQLAWLAGVASVFLLLTYHLRRNPEEAVHFIEYGVLSLFLFRGFAHACRTKVVYLDAVLLCAVLGTVDEILQWVMPGRFFDFRDIRFNAAAGILVQVAVWRGLRPSWIRPSWPLSDFRIPCRLAALELLLIGCCISNTPPRVEYYASRIPGLGFLSRNPSVMSEFGYRHVDPQIGTFFSRLTLEGLDKEDAAAPGQRARTLDTFFGRETYSDFLTRYGPGIDPFLHEARVHAHTRDVYVRAARDPEATETTKRKRLTMAYRENLLLERYFGQTLAASRFAYPPESVARLASEQDPRARYVSAVSANVITRVSELGWWLGTLVLLWGLGLLHGRARAASLEDGVVS